MCTVRHSEVLWCRAEIGSAIKNHHDIMAHWEALLPGRVLHVPYELLVEDQEGWSRRLLQHCGLPWDDRVLDFHKTARDVQTASLGQASGRDCPRALCLSLTARACLQAISLSTPTGK